MQMKIRFVIAMPGTIIRFFLKRMESAIAKASRHKQPLLLLELDLDGFKAVNDDFGHDIGDKVLIDVSKKVRELLRLEDGIFRMGGDEFIVIIDTPMSENDVENLSKRIIEKINKPVKIDNNEVRVGASMGIAIDENGQMSQEDLFKIADKALYEAKNAGKNQYRIMRN